MRKILCAFVALMALTANAKVILPKFFSDNMVLQQQTECYIWGKGEPGSKVIISTSWDKKSHNVPVNKDGHFGVKVKTPKAGGPYFIGFKDRDYVQLNNVMIGEVWICSGQSNMEMQMKGFKQQPVEGTTEELLHCQDVNLRLFTVKRHASLTPEWDVTGQWNEANSASVRDFSATAYYFGKALRSTLNVPVGLICTSWGGSACEAWMAPEWLKAFPKVKQTITEEDVKKLQQRCPSALYNGQLKPLIGYTMRGAIWYQGEDNVPRYDFYAPLLKAMVEGWRSDWKQGNFPFYYCQIAPYDYSLIQWKGSEYLREQQAKAESMIDNARMAVLMDAGLEYGIHPRKKRQAGERLAILALSNTYQMKGLPDFAVYKEVAFQNDTAVVSFDRSKEWVYFEHGTTSKNFEVAGADKVFYPASKVWVSRNRVYVVCKEVKTPVAVRYAFKDWADGDLMHDGLPVSSFRTDNWEPAPTIVSKGAGDYNNPVSVAGLFPLEHSGRLIWNFNAGWRFYLGDVAGAETKDFNDNSWEVISIPHSVQLMPAEASGCRNYQGKAWYRKHFVLPQECAGRDVTLHFEAIMGKQTIYINGKKVKEHEGGYLPITIPLSGYQVGDDLVIAICADNSDDKTYPPGKKQMTLDFAYHGGIYRDVWLIAKNKVAITDAIEENKVAGGGLFVHYANISEKSAEVFINTEVRNSDSRPRTVTVENVLAPSVSSNAVARQQAKLRLQPGETRTITQRFLVKSPKLWSPETPYLYQIATRIKDGKTCLDGGITKIGIRSFEFVRTDDAQGRQPGFYLNGKKYHQLVGANRHQDFAYVGNALPNSQQWRDAKRLRDAGFTIIRTAHYPQDPSFMDACDELGLFIIVATPGWQYWNKDKGWDEKVHENTRNIIRRDRNHPCVLMWEPILNETRYPEDFALQALQITKDEYPYPYRPVAAADIYSAGVAENYDVVYGWPGDDFKADKPKQCIFTREFGELVDDWYAHNNLNRASRSWGERPMLTQALSLYRSTQELYHTTGQFIGGCQWHPFDHQRGYHPDPYWGGIYDAFRQKKTAFSMFAAVLRQATEQPIVAIAHEMTQFSEKDVTIFSNCDSVRLTMYDGEHCWTLPVENGMVVFKDAWDFFEARNWSYTQRNWQNVKMVAEGIIKGKVVCTEEKMPSRRSTKLRLYVDEMGKKLVADGSDFVVVVCEVTDDLGHVRRLAKENIRFTIEGEGEIIGDASINANPRAVEWGSAPVLIRSTKNAGKIIIKAEVQFPGTHAPTPAELEIESVPYDLPMCFSESYKTYKSHETYESYEPNNSHKPFLSEKEKAKMLQEVEAQQADFGIQK